MTRPVVLGVVVLVLLAGCGGSKTSSAPATSCGRSVPAKVPSPAYARDSAFNTPIQFDARIHPDSAELVRGLEAGAESGGFVLAVRAYTVPVYIASTDDPLHDVRMTAEWAPRDTLQAVPFPAGATPDPEEDGHLAIIDPAKGCEYDFWQAKEKDGRWSASWGTALPLSGDGVSRDEPGARASGFGLLAGLVLPNELRRGRIDHALVFAYPSTRPDAVAPASRSDGEDTGPAALPEGARVQLDPALDLDTLDLTPYERTIARALQRYGMILGDTGGTLSLYAMHPQSAPEGAYAGLLPAGPYAPLDGVPLDRLRVLAWG